MSAASQSCPAIKPSAAGKRCDIQVGAFCGLGWCFSRLLIVQGSALASSANPLVGANPAGSSFKALRIRTISAAFSGPGYALAEGTSQSLRQVQASAGRPSFRSVALGVKRGSSSSQSSCPLPRPSRLLELWQLSQLRAFPVVCGDNRANRRRKSGSCRLGWLAVRIIPGTKVSIVSSSSIPSTGWPASVFQRLSLH